MKIHKRLKNFVLKLDQSVLVSLEVSVNLPISLICIFAQLISYSSISSTRFHPISSTRFLLIKYAIRPTDKLTTTSGDTGNTLAKF